MGEKVIAKDITEVAVVTKDIKVPFSLKRNMIRPILMGLRDAIIKKGEITILGFGRFYVYRKKVSVGIGSPDKKMILTVAFRPSRIFVKAVEAVWSKTQKVEIELPPGESSPSEKAPVQSAPNTESGASSAGGDTAEDSRTTDKEDW